MHWQQCAGERPKASRKDILQTFFTTCVVQKDSRNTYRNQRIFYTCPETMSYVLQLVGSIYSTSDAKF